MTEDEILSELEEISVITRRLSGEREGLRIDIAVIDRELNALDRRANSLHKKLGELR